MAGPEPVEQREFLDAIGRYFADCRVNRGATTGPRESSFGASEMKHGEEDTSRGMPWAPRSSPALHDRSRRRPVPSASDRAYLQIKEQILRGHFAGGELISEGEIAQNLSISRTPVREAFLRLQAEGLLKLYPKKGALVSLVSNHEIEMVFETRLLLERFAAEKVVGLGLGPAVAEHLEGIVTLQQTALAAGDSGPFLQLDRDFHQAIFAATGNEIIADVYASMRDRQRRMSSEEIHAIRARAESIIAEHRELTRLLRLGDLSMLHNVIAEHIQKTKEALRT